METPIVAVVLAGGTGTRLYPATRSDRPKQFQAFGGDRSLLERAIDRVAFADETYVLTRPEYAEGVRDLAPDAAVLTEPAPKDTGPALAYATHRVREQVGDCAVLAVPSDHHVTGDFRSVAERAARAAVETRGLVTMGVEPTRPETGFGYVEPGADHGDWYQVERFHEKPDETTAREYVDRGFYWNAGTFAWTPEAFLAAAAETPLAPVVEGLDAGDPEGAFADVDPVSVDYAVMERAEDVFVVPATFEWADLGTWDAVGRHLRDRAASGGADAAGEPTAESDGGTGDNAVLGDAVTVDAAGNVIATDGHASVVGCEDLVVASYDGHTLVLPREQSQRVREVVARLRENGRF